MKQLMVAGELYHADDAELDADYARAQALVERFNAAPHADRSARATVLRELLAEVGEGVEVRPRLVCEYGERVRIGPGTFVNAGCVLLDGAAITIGAHCQIATNVQLVTATHPVDPEVRRTGWESAHPITLEDNVWLGAGVIVCPGVRVGRDTVVGAGAVVTRDLPSGVVAAGLPARVQRALGAHDELPFPERCLAPPAARTSSPGDDRQIT